MAALAATPGGAAGRGRAAHPPLLPDGAFPASAPLPATASRPAPDGIGRPGQTYRQALRLLAGPGALDINLVIGSRSPRLDEPMQGPLRGLSAGELTRLLLQLTGTELRKAARRTFVLVDAEDRRRFGVDRTAVLRPLTTLPSRVLDAVRANPALAARIPVERISADDSRGTLYLVASPDEIAALRRVVRQLDGEDRAGGIWARIPVSYLDEGELRAHLEALAAADRAQLPDFTFSASGRMVVARAPAADLERLQTWIRAVDLPRAQVAIQLRLVETTRQALRRLGVTLGRTALEVDRLDRLLGGAVPEGVAGSPATVEVFLQRSGARTISTRILRALDGETATLQVGQVRNVRTGTAQLLPGGATVTSQVTEVPLGIQVAVTPRVHPDGTTTLELDVSDERALEIRDFGVDRETSQLSTTVRARTGVPLLVTGFDQRQTSRVRQTVEASSRTRLESEQAMILTVFADPAASPRPGKPAR